MLKNYLKVALRNLRKYKAYAFINVAGLAVGLACFALILLFVRDEVRYDGHYAQAERIYRLVVDVQTSRGFQQTAQSAPAWGPSLKADFPEVEEAVRFKPPNQAWMVGFEDRLFYEKGWAFADSTTFDVFDIPLARGEAHAALTAPFSVVVSQAMAEKYFGAADPMGKTLVLDSQYNFVVTGVMADLPRNGHFHFDFLAAFNTLEQVPIYGGTDFSQQQFPIVYTYLLLAEGASAAALEAKLGPAVSGYVEAHFPLAQSGFAVAPSLQPLRDIHLRSNRENEIEPNGNAATVYVFLAVGVFILLIACINFMNLATARSASRAREVGMRKVAGAHRGQLIQQFLGESVLLALLALVVALVLVGLALPAFDALTGKAIGLADLVHPLVLPGLVAVALAAGLLAGSYPAFFLSAFRPAAVLKGDLHAGGGAGLRKALIVFQFGISLVLLVSTGVVYHQLNYVRAQQLGFDKEHVVVIQLTDPTPRGLYRAYKNRILGEANVVNVSAASSAPASLLNQVPLRPVAAPEDENWLLHAYFSDFDFFETMDMRLVAGRAISRDFPADTLDGIVINETAARAFGWDDYTQALGQQLAFPRGNNDNNNPPLRVVGVVRDFHSQSAHEQIAPAMVMYANVQAYLYVFVRLRPGDPRATVAALEEAWRQVIPNYAFDYAFLDDHFDRLYRADALVGTLLGFFAGLTIFIACLGLFGLASFMAEQRTKEIGVRKTLGASVGSIVLLLSKEFTKLVAAAFVVAAPVAYLAMHRWLDGFAYRVEISWQIFLLAGLGALLVALLTVSYQSVKAALANPVDALRTE